MDGAAGSWGQSPGWPVEASLCAPCRLLTVESILFGTLLFLCLEPAGAPVALGSIQSPAPSMGRSVAGPLWLCVSPALPLIPPPAPPPSSLPTPHLSSIHFLRLSHSNAFIPSQKSCSGAPAKAPHRDHHPLVVLPLDWGPFPQKALWAWGLQLRKALEVWWGGRGTASASKY